MIIRPSLITQIIYSAICALIPFTIKFVLYILTTLVNKSFEISSSSENDYYALNHTPPNIPTSLWQHSKDFSHEHPISESDVMQLITDGYNPEDVYAFYTLLSENDYKFRERHHNKKQIENGSYLNCCGKILHFRITREFVEAVFPGNNSLFYTIFGLIFIFFSFFLSFLINNLYPLWQKAFLIYSLGISLILFLIPPEVDPYSQTKGDISNGLTRLFTITLLFSILYYLNRIKTQEKYIPELNITINFKLIFESIRIFTIITCGFIFVTIHFYITSPLIFIHYILENFNTYIFGCSQSKTLLHAVILFVRGVACFASIYFINSEKFYIQALIIPIVTFIIQIPIFWPNLLVVRWKSHFLLTFFSIILHYLISLISIKFTHPRALSTKITAPIIVFLELFLPHISRNSNYFYIFNFLLKGKMHRRVYVTFRYFYQNLAAIFIVSQIVQLKTSSDWILTLAIVCALTKAFTESHVFAVAMIIFTFTFIYEFPIDNPGFAMLLSIIIARKIYSMIPILKTFNAIPYMGLSDVLDVVTYLLLQIPIPDKYFKVPATVLSLIFGNLWFDFFNFHFAKLPAHFRPSCFWEDDNKMKISNTLNANLTEHPVETPVYISIQRTFETSLANLINSYRLGVVDTGSILIMMDLNADILAIIEIISRDPNCVHFRLRGLEYYTETICHATEKGYMTRLIEKYQTFPNIRHKFIQDTTSYELIRTSIVLSSTGVSKYDFASWFVGVRPQVALKWMIFTFGTVLRDFNVFDCNYENNNTQSDFAEALRTVDVNLSPENFEEAQNIFKVIKNTLYINDMISYRVLMNIFLEQANYNTQNMQNIDEILRQFTRRFIVVLSCVTISIMPEIDEVYNEDEIRESLANAFQNYVALPVTSPDFEREFNINQRDIFTIVTTKGNENILLFQKKEASWSFWGYNSAMCKSIWASEAVSKLYFQEDQIERLAIQSNNCHLHNIITQSCNHPIGYPAFVSPIVTSYVNPFIDF